MISTIRYEKNDGIPNFGNSFLVNLFDRMVDEGIDKIVFRDRLDMSVGRWVWLFVSGYAQLFISCPRQSTVGAIAWLTKLEHRSCHVHFCVFESARGPESFKIGKALCHKIFESGINCITAFVPVDNEKMLHYSEKVGFKNIGIFPDYYYVAKQKTTIDAHAIYLPKGV